MGALTLMALCVPMWLESALECICCKASEIVDKSDPNTLCLVMLSKLG